MMRITFFIILFLSTYLAGVKPATGSSVYLNKNNSTYLAGVKPATGTNTLPNIQPWLIAQNNTKEKSNEINAYDPFADYSEFENTAEEQENINFFQTGRFLSIGAVGGIQLFTLNMSALYQIGPTYGGYLNYFFVLNFAIQFALIASTHSIALKSESGQAFLGAADFISMGVDFKYFLDKNLFNKNFSWLQPYFFLGVYHSSVTMVATFTDQAGFFEDKGFGLNMGLGLEFQFLKKIHFGLQYAFKFVTLEQEAVPLILNIGNGKQNTNFRPYGDWMHITMLLGVNF